jgi:hypothetical protein
MCREGLLGKGLLDPRLTTFEVLSCPSQIDISQRLSPLC